MNTIECPACKEQTLEGSKYCCMCGVDLNEARQRAEEQEKMRNGEIPLICREFATENGKKVIEVYCHDITTFPEDIDILTISAYSRSYKPLERTVIRALEQTRKIVVSDIAENSLMDLRQEASCWLSQELSSTAPDDAGTIHRIGCVEMRTPTIDASGDKTAALGSISTYFRMLDLAAAANIKISTIAMPLLGGGRQKLDSKLVAIPLINEAVTFLKRNPSADRIIFIEYSYEKAELLANTIKDSYQLTELVKYNPTSDNDGAPYVFISYSNTGDRKTAEMLCDILKEKGIRYWFAPEHITSGSFAGEIVNAINRSTHFICLISSNSMKSEHVLNELNLAFQHLKDGIVLLPYRLDDQRERMQPEFEYYLSRFQWHYGCPPPAEDRAREFINGIFG